MKAASLYIEEDEQQSITKRAFPEVSEFPTSDRITKLYQDKVSVAPESLSREIKEHILDRWEEGKRADEKRASFYDLGSEGAPAIEAQQRFLQLAVGRALDLFGADVNWNVIDAVKGIKGEESYKNQVLNNLMALSCHAGNMTRTWPFARWTPAICPGLFLSVT